MKSYCKNQKKKQKQQKKTKKLRTKYCEPYKTDLKIKSNGCRILREYADNSLQ